MADMLSRLQDEFGPHGAAPKKMFGGTCFMLNGNMVACTSKRGLLARTGPDHDPLADGQENASRMEMGGREMKGYWLVEEDLSAEEFRYWIDRALEFNRTLPRK
jgi:TfoX/Sxy family transcriptional regulator of competence genes